MTFLITIYLICSVYLSRGVHEFGNWIDDSVFSCTSIGPFRVIRGKFLVCLPSLFSLHLLAWNVFQRKLTILCRSKIFPLHDFLILFFCLLEEFYFFLVQILSASFIYILSEKSFTNISKRITNSKLPWGNFLID